VGRITLFDLELPAVSLPLQPIANFALYLPGVNVTLDSEAAADLNQVFKVNVFAAGMPIRTATVTAVSKTRFLRSVVGLQAAKPVAERLHP